MHPTCLQEGNGEGRSSSTCRAPGSPGGTEPVARVAREQLQNPLKKQGYGKGLNLVIAGPEKAGLLGVQHREGAGLGFPELEPGEAGFTNSSRVQV